MGISASSNTNHPKPRPPKPTSQPRPNGPATVLLPHQIPTTRSAHDTAIPRYRGKQTEAGEVPPGPLLVQRIQYMRTPASAYDVRPPYITEDRP